MKKRVYDYFKRCACTTVHQCAEALKTSDVCALRNINELLDDGFIKCTVLPLGNSINADASSFYSVCNVYCAQ